MRILRNIAGVVILIVFVFAIREVFLWNTPPVADLLYQSGEVYSPPIDTHLTYSDTESSCADLSIVYDIGDMDVRFGMSKEEFSSAIQEAESIWESAIKRDVFVINPVNHHMKINLVFDERQETTLALKRKMEGIDSAKTRYNIVKNEHQGLSSQSNKILEEINALQETRQTMTERLSAQIATHNERVRIHDDQVAYWNGRGGAPSPEYERLIQEQDEISALYRETETRRQELGILSSNLNKKIDDYNSLVEQINVVAGILNNLAESLNYNVAFHNRLIEERGEFVTGSYTSNGEKFINIYQFYDRRELVIIIAHELGHALGLSHATQNDSIMYHRVARQELKLSEEDLLLINKICE